MATLVCFGLDKLKARKKKTRIREADLLVLALLCPFGSLLGIAALRHKSTRFTFWLTASLAAVGQAVGVFDYRHNDEAWITLSAYHCS